MRCIQKTLKVRPHHYTTQPNRLPWHSIFCLHPQYGWSVSSSCGRRWCRLRFLIILLLLLFHRLSSNTRFQCSVECCATGRLNNHANNLLRCGISFSCKIHIILPPLCIAWELKRPTYDIQHTETHTYWWMERKKARPYRL